MLKKVFLNTSHLLYRVHTKAYSFVKRYLQEDNLKNSNVAPYILNTKSAAGQIKIIHINGNFIIGGTTQLIVDIIENTSDVYKHEIIVPDYTEPLPYQPVPIHKFPLIALGGVYAFLQQEQPAAVHIHYWVRQDSLYAPIAIWYATIFRICEALKIKVIQNINVPTEPYISPSVVHNVFVSNFVLNNFNLNSSSFSSSVIYPGSNFSHFRNDNLFALPSKSIGMVYRLDRDKLNAESIEVFIAIAKRQVDVQCYIIGGGYYLEHYRRRVEEEKLENNFIFTGVVSYNSLPDYYRKISIFVSPVHDESFGQVTPFAMSMGLCVAGYDTGALSEILGSKETLVEYGEIGYLADIIISLINNPRKRIEIGRLNQIRAHQNFSVENMISQYRDLYSNSI